MATHGSLTKAGKVRGQTPKVEGRKIVGDSSSVANKSNFKKRFALGRYPRTKQTWSKKKTSLTIYHNSHSSTINFKNNTVIKY